jgi:uncharacterized protein YjbJ (UPF0337 family)
MTRERQPISIVRKIAHKAEAVKGDARKTVGRLAGSWRLRASGPVTRSRATSNWPRAKIKDAIRR